VSTKLTNTDPYPATPDQLMAMMQDPDYLTGKYTALGDVKFDVKTHDVHDNGVNIVVDREIPSNLPGFAKKIMGETNHMVQSETWRKDGDAYTAAINIDSPGKPIQIHGDMRISAVSDTESHWVVNFDIKASIPLVGGKLEKVVEDETKQTLVKEFEFNKSWLASH